ncbi:GntR family transcriptional regulator [Devosia sp. Root105]|uniref:GntR family transcriptional regulator n=1 Tax=Devosia sp. Root105 TaxID=1736423 RepID=UPI0009E9B9A0|nr:GntR family transcriptional regulator [Devosia sp. Root105]
MALSSNRNAPLYAQIEATLRERIRQMQPGEPLPSDRALASEFAVSYVTLRQAMARLASDGLVSREVGRGTFVQRSVVEKDMTGLTSFSEDMLNRGMRVHAAVLECAVKPATPEIADALRVLAGSPVTHIRRLRFADDIPMALEAVVLSAVTFPGLETVDFATQSLYGTLERRYGVRLRVAKGTLGAVTPTDEEAELLQISREVPLIVARRVAYNESGVPIEYGESRYRSDRYQVPIELHRPSGDPRTGRR